MKEEKKWIIRRKMHKDELNGGISHYAVYHYEQYYDDIEYIIVLSQI